MNVEGKCECEWSNLSVLKSFWSVLCMRLLTLIVDCRVQCNILRMPEKSVVRREFALDLCGTMDSYFY